MADPVVDINDLLEPPAKPEDQNLSKKEIKAREEQAIIDWGFPGHLTKEQADVYVKFRDEIAKRGDDFRDTVYSFSEIEGEANCLTRWLRARKYVYEDVIKMVEEAVECRSEPSSKGYYPEPKEALGVNPAVYLTQYPQVYGGFCKIGCPVFYTKPGKIVIDGVECISTLQNILDYHWYIMQHDFKNRLLNYKKENPNFCRFETLTILDLENVTLSKLNQRTMNIIKQQTFVDSLCYPETMYKTVIVNAPKWFAATWSIIKGWLDPRTVSKIKMFTSVKAAKPYLLEICDEDQIASDYGGTGHATTLALEKDAKALGGGARVVTELMHIRSYQTCTIEIKEREELAVNVHTRGTVGAKFSITEAKSKKKIVDGISVKHTVPKDAEIGTELPTTVSLTASGRIQGPKKIEIKGQSMGGRFGSEPYLVAGSIFAK